MEDLSEAETCWECGCPKFLEDEFGMLCGCCLRGGTCYGSGA